MWFLITLLGYLLAAVVAILDKFILTTSVKNPVVYTFYSTIFAFALFAAYPFLGETMRLPDLLLAVVSGLSFGLGIWALFAATRRGEASHMMPFSGSLLTIAIALLSLIFLHEQLSPIAYSGVAILAAASLLLSFEKTKTHAGIHIGFLWAALAAGLLAVSHVIAKYLYLHYSFLTALMWSKATIGLAGLVCLFFPAVRRTFKRNRRIIPKTFGRRHTAGIVTVNKALGAVSILLIQYASALASVTVVNALVGAQFVFMFLGIYLLTRFRPNIFQEYFTKRELRMEAAAIVLVLIGSALAVI